MADWYIVELYRTAPGGAPAVLVEKWRPNTSGGWSDFHLSIPSIPGEYVYELRITDAGRGGVSNAQLIGMSFKR